MARSKLSIGPTGCGRLRADLAAFCLFTLSPVVAAARTTSQPANYRLSAPPPKLPGSSHLQARVKRRWDTCYVWTSYCRQGGSVMDRRTFVSTAAGALLVKAFPASAQPAKKPPDRRFPCRHSGCCFAKRRGVQAGPARARVCGIPGRFRFERSLAASMNRHGMSLATLRRPVGTSNRARIARRSRCSSLTSANPEAWSTTVCGLPTVRTTSFFWLQPRRIYDEWRNG